MAYREEKRLLVEFILDTQVVRQTPKVWEMQKHPSSYPLCQAQKKQCCIIYHVEKKLKSCISQVLAQTIFQLMNPIRLGCAICGNYWLVSFQHIKFPGVNTT